MGEPSQFSSLSGKQLNENLTRHKKLFQNKDIVNIENLKDLDKCGKGLFSFSCFPLKLENCDGSPIRAVAWFED